MKKRISAVITAFTLCFAAVFGIFSVTADNTSYLVANAASADFPMQLMNIASKDNSMILAENGTADHSSVSMKTPDGSLSGSWRFDMVNTDSRGTFFKLVNAESGRMLTPDGYNVSESSAVIMYGAESHQTQHWYVVPVKNDRLGNGLYYKIVNYSDTSLALTQSSNGMILSDFKGADN